MPARPQALEPTPPALTLVRFPDPVAERVGHHPGSPYVEFVWLGVLGPSTTLAWQRLARQAANAERTSVDVADLAVSLGLGESIGRNSMVSRTLARLVAFDAARRNGDVLAVRLALPDVPQRQLRRLSASAMRAHACLSHGTSGASATATVASPARTVGL